MLAELYFRARGYLEVALADDIKLRAVATGVATYEEVFCGSKPPHVRTWLQEEGTERGRHLYGEDVWARSLFARLQRIEAQWGFDKFVVTDVRFLNEVRYIAGRDGLVLRVHAPIRNSGNGMTPEQRSHESETASSLCANADVHGVILNDPEYVEAVEWQIASHLYLAGFEQAPDYAPPLRPSRREVLLHQMLPSDRYGVA